MTQSRNQFTRWPVFAAIAWVSLTLIAASQSEDRMSLQARRFWIVAGQAGLISALGLFELNLRRAREHEQALAGESRTDVLTGLANRRRFDEELERRWQEWRRKDRNVSLLLIDIDHFKRLNDEHGHLTGDRVLSQLGDLLGEQVRGTDLAARYGGEEFAILAVATESGGAVQAAERIRREVSAHVFLDDSLPVSHPAQHHEDMPEVTVSIGVSHFNPDDHSPRQLILRADEALYAAKRAGRNQVSTVVGDSDRVVLAGRFSDELAENVGLADPVVSEH